MIDLLAICVANNPNVTDITVSRIITDNFFYQLQTFFICMAS